METAYDGKWLWNNVIRDLRRHGLEDFKIERLEATAITASAMGIFFKIEWQEHKYCVLTMLGYMPSIIEVFEEVLEIPPLAIYEKNGSVVIEFEREDPEKRIAELIEEKRRGLLRPISSIRWGR